VHDVNAAGLQVFETAVAVAWDEFDLQPLLGKEAADIGHPPGKVAVRWFGNPGLEYQRIGASEGRLRAQPERDHG
jgi:hypothetical protein